MYKVELSTLEEIYILLSSYEKDVLKSNKVNKKKLNRIYKAKDKIAFIFYNDK